MSTILVSPHIWKSTKILHNDDCLMILAETFWKNMCLIACTLPSAKIAYILTTPPCLFGAVSQSFLTC